MVVENRKIQLIRPPVLVRPRPGSLGSRGGDCRVLALADARSRILVVRPNDVFISHVSPSPSYLFPANGSSPLIVGALDPGQYRRSASHAASPPELDGRERRRRNTLGASSPLRESS